MKRYMATIDGAGIFLTKDSQFDEALKSGCTIIEIEGEIERTIATPEDGFLLPRPELEVAKKLDIPRMAFKAAQEGGDNNG